MVTSKNVLAKIKEIIDKNYKTLTISVLGKSVFTEEELSKLRELGIDTSNEDSFLQMAYNHNFLNEHGSQISPTSVPDMEAQQSGPGVKPEGEAHDYTGEHLDENAKQLIDKLKQDVSARIEGIVRDNNHDYKMNALQNLTRPDEADDLVKESSLGKVKQQLRDFSKDANRDWNRVVVTEVSNAIGLGSVDRIVSQNAEKAMEDVYVYRIVVEDASLCKYCRRFYLDSDGSPKLYKLSTLLSNGSNYGKKVAGWKPVVVATHPNERCSPMIELKPGWKLVPGGGQTFIGLEKWSDYILDKLTA